MKRGKTLKKLQQSIADPLVDIWFEDEVHFTLHSTITRMWSPVGLQPKVLFEPNRLKAGYFGVVNVNTGEFSLKLLIRLTRDFRKIHASVFGG